MKTYSKRIEHPHFEALIYVLRCEWDEDADDDCAIVVIHAWVGPDRVSFKVSLGFEYEDEGADVAIGKAFNVLEKANTDTISDMLRDQPILKSILDKLDKE